LRALAALPQGRPRGTRLALALSHLFEPHAHALGLGRRLVGAAPEPRGALAQQHHLVLGAAALLLAVAQSALRRLQLALDLEQRELAVVEPGLELVDLGGHAL